MIRVKVGKPPSSEVTECSVSGRVRARVWRFIVCVLSSDHWDVSCLHVADEFVLVENWDLMSK